MSRRSTRHRTSRNSPALSIRKYDTDYPLPFFTENACFRLRPKWVFSLDEADFVGTPTRWVFADDQ